MPKLVKNRKGRCTDAVWVQHVTSSGCANVRDVETAIGTAETMSRLRGCEVFRMPDQQHTFLQTRIRVSSLKYSINKSWLMLLTRLSRRGTSRPIASKLTDSGQRYGSHSRWRYRCDQNETSGHTLFSHISSKWCLCFLWVSPAQAESRARGR